MPRLVGSVTGLVCFAAMVARGWSVGNPFDVVLSRALTGLFLGVPLGAIAGWAAMTVLNEWQSAAPPTAPTSAQEPGSPPPTAG